VPFPEYHCEVLNGVRRRSTLTRKAMRLGLRTIVDKCGVRVHAGAVTRFDLASQKADMLNFLDRNGYAVVRNAFGAPEAELTASVETAKSKFWEFLEGVPGCSVQRADPTTWTCEHGWFPSPTTGIVSGLGVGQSDFMWQIRLLPRVREVFREIWKDDDLLVSFDGANAFRPWKYDPRWVTEVRVCSAKHSRPRTTSISRHGASDTLQGGWWHVDQNAVLPKRQGRVAVQGLVTLTPVNEDTGGLCVIPGSHLAHADMCDRNPWSRVCGDYLPIPEDDGMLRDGALLICAQPGDLILWDSRTVHCNAPAFSSLDPGNSTMTLDMELDAPEYQDGDGGVRDMSMDDVFVDDIEFGQRARGHRESLSRKHMASTLGRESSHVASAAASLEFSAEHVKPLDLARLAAYVCMTPAKWATNNTIQQRQVAYMEGTGSSHWPHDFSPTASYPGYPRRDPRSISKEQRRLIGFDRKGPVSAPLAAAGC